MRIKLKFSGLKNKAIPRDHFYQLSGLVYSMIEQANPDYSKWLHDKGFVDGNKSFKFFCFSRIIPEPAGYTRGGDNGELIVFTKNEGTLYISSPVREFMQNLVDFLLINREIRVMNHSLLIERAFATSQEFSDGEELFKCISPIVLSTRSEEYTTPTYLRAYQEPDLFDEYLTRNAKEKLKIFHGVESDIELTVDREYLKRTGRKSNLRLKIKEDTEVFGSIVPVKIKGKKEEIAFLYHCGLGQKNSLGMGMIELAGKRF
ncbi:MAG: CRISPR-associated endoribonuclease Cas6 [Mesotoga sp.]